MRKQKVMIEILTEVKNAFAMHTAALTSFRESESQVEQFAKGLARMGVDVDPAYAPLPMFIAAGAKKAGEFRALSAFVSAEENPDRASSSTVLTAEVDAAKLTELAKKKNVRVYPASRLHLMGCGCAGGSRGASVETADVQGAADALGAEEMDIMDLAGAAGATDCRPFRPGVTVSTIRQLLGVSAVWNAGFSGQNVIVALVDEGVNGRRYPVIGGLESATEDEPGPGQALITSHGSMCAADVLVAAPWAKLLDYPLLAEATSADGAQMFQAILDRRRQNGTPQVVSNSYGFYGIPTQAQMPTHEAWDVNHPFHRKVREVIASGAAVFFAAGNCGTDCPSGNCKASATGPNRSINASAALKETITIAAVNSRRERVGYSSQGLALAAPGFERNKPDFAAYTHFFGNFGPGRPGGLSQPFDNGTSAATPVAAGVAALLISAFPGLTPDRLRAALKAGAIEVGAPGWDPLHGHGVINAAASYQRLRNNEI